MAIQHTVNGDSSKIMAEAKSRITGSGGSVSGNESSGTFQVKGFEGTYTAGDGRIEIAITKKPFLVPESLVKAWLSENVKA